MKVDVVDDAAALPQRAAAVIAEDIRRAVTDRGRCAIAFSGGRTPAAMLAALAEHDLPWPSVQVFQVDERVAPDGDAERNLTTLRASLLDAAPLPAGNVHPMPVTDTDLDAAAARYAATLQQVCGDPAVLDVVHLGLGADGHTASLVPGDAALDITDRDVAVTGTYGSHRRLTLTYPVLNRARRLVWLVAGADKAAALACLVDADASIPAGRVARSRAIVVTDVGG